jgi:hypothetical protein
MDVSDPVDIGRDSRRPDRSMRSSGRLIHPQAAARRLADFR